jgi:glucose/arabinose dehydrogenase/PKD repeat protein
MSINGRALVGAALLLVTTTAAGGGPAAPAVAARPPTAPSAGAAIAGRVQATAAATDDRGRRIAAGTFRNDILATGFDLPTTIEFLPDGRLLLAELAGRINVLSPPYTEAGPTPFLQLTNVGSAGVQQGIYDIALDPHFATNHFYYVFYTAGTPNHDRLSRFTANASLTGTVAGSEDVLYEDPENANAEHHGGAVVFGNDGKLYFTTGEHFDAGVAQSLDSPRGKIHRINPDGSVPTDDPFYDGAGPHWDSIWAYGLRNPFRAYYDAPTGRLFVADVGGNDYSTAKEEVNVGAAGANYGWPDFEGACPAPDCTSPIYSYAHNGRDAAITGGFVYHGTQFPAAYRGNYFFADYTQNWIKRLTFDVSGDAHVANFEPPNGAVDGPYGDIVSLAEGPDGALYYLDLGYSDISGDFGVSKLRRIRYVGANQPPIAVARAEPTSGSAPLRVTFSSAGSRDPEGRTLTRSWTFGDGTSSTRVNPIHLYTRQGRYTVRLTVSDGVNSTVAAPITITVGTPPTARILAPINGVFFRAGDVISFRGRASDAQDGPLPASAFRWNIDFLHEGHVHPGIPRTGVRRGTFTIPTDGHDFSGNTRYRIALTVVDSSGLRTTRSVIIWPTKVNLTFKSSPGGRTIHLDGIAKTVPFVHDTLVGFHHTIQAPDQVAGGKTYTFASWSDGGAREHQIVVPATARTIIARFTVTSAPGAFVQQNYATPQTPQSTVAVPYSSAQTAGDTNIVAVGWNDATSTITSLTDSRGNAYALAAPIQRGDELSQAIYYAKNVLAAAAGANTVTVHFSSAVPFADVRVTEYGGLAPTDPFDATASNSGNSGTASSGNVTTASPSELIFAAGMTKGAFSGPAAGFTTRVITNPDADIVVDRVVSSANTYGAGATLSGAAAWVMQAATFRAASP